MTINSTEELNALVARVKKAQHQYGEHEKTRGNRD